MKDNGGKTFTWDDPAILLGFFVILYILGWAAWYFAHTEISAGYMYIRYFQLWIFNFIGGFADLPGLSFIRDWVQKTCLPEDGIGLCQRDFSGVQWRDISSSGLIFNIFNLLVLTILCVKMFLKVNASHPKLKFAKTHNIQSFVNENKELYPHLNMFSELDLISQPLDHPMFGMSLTSRQFSYKHRLISGWQENSDGTFIPTLDRMKSYQVFHQQLGKLWTKSTDLSPAETLLVAIAIPRVAVSDPNLDESVFRKALDDSNDMINWCWNQFKATGKTKKQDSEDDSFSWLHPDVDLSKARQIILTYIGYPNVQQVIEQHAFNRTVIFAMFMQARRLGVLQPAEMRWLRFYDRELWYILDSVGRLACFAEAAAVLSHYLYESKQMHAIVEPQLDKAINGLETALTAFKYTKNEKESYDARKE